MKELIEKIKEIRGKPFSEYERLSHNKAVDEILNIIQEQESKPFAPTECGLIFDDDENAEHDGWFIIHHFEYTKLRLVLVHILDNTYSVCVQSFIKNQWVFQFYVVRNIKIPNHRQGVELLRNLGVIE